MVAQIRLAVDRAGFPDRAAQLAVWEQGLRSGELEELQAARRQLRSVVHGMGGLLDIHYGSAEETLRVVGLIDLMWKQMKVDEY